MSFGIRVDNSTVYVTPRAAAKAIIRLALEKADYRTYFEESCFDGDFEEIKPHILKVIAQIHKKHRI